MENDAIREVLLADDWEQVTGADLAEGDYVAWRDDFGSWHEGPVIQSLDSKSRWWQEGQGSIKDADVLLRAPKEFAHLDRRFDKDGQVHVNISWEPRHPVYVNARLITPDLLMMDGARYCSLRSKQVDVDTLTKEKPA